jgi:hypothetical protein
MGARILLFKIQIIVVFVPLVAWVVRIETILYKRTDSSKENPATNVGVELYKKEA